MRCYCGSGLSYSVCCQPLHTRQQTASSYEQLMRSRYSAFCQPELTYLQQSCVAELHAEQSPEQMRDFIEQAHFVRLQILPLPQSLKAEDDQGYVHFQVWYLLGKQLHSFRELSHFVRQQGRWLYSSGTVTELAAIKVGRNDACPCGSGRKFKSCQIHQASGQAAT